MFGVSLLLVAEGLLVAFVAVTLSVHSVSLAPRFVKPSAWAGKVGSVGWSELCGTWRGARVVLVLLLLLLLLVTGL